MRKLILILGVVLLILPNVVLANEAELEEILTPYIEQMMVENNVQGFVLSVVSKEGVLYKKPFGVKNIYTNEPETNKSLFHMASVTKTFVATALMQLHEQGMLDVDKPVVDVVPYFVLVDNRYKDLTVRQFASHISGMPDFDSNPWHDPDYDEEALERFVRNFISHKFLTHAPETNFEYCNTGFELLGDVIAKASGMSFEDYVWENILLPLGMVDSTLLIQSADMTNLNSLHRPKDGELRVADVYPYNRMHGPSSTLISNIDDMGRWVRMNLNGGTLEGNRILKEETLKAMWQPALGKFDQVGFTWQRRIQQGHQTIFHGGNDGYKSYVIMIPDLDIGFVMMSNTTTQPYHDFAQSIADKLIEYKGK
ncbi:MAG: beta-lactamase family protein [Kordiimonadaceae bacterium]|jgi:CubicO group peptidase (beta-lactamase class C family)|nr:beta-lactamase family protein [Kordiimonadaceae bacterium]MBT6031389.1 beta-lactamase family protein [Kordiimonadaceae bacterium]